MPSKVVLALSGGLDSTVLLYGLRAAGNEVFPVTFRYNSKHNPWERRAAAAVCVEAGVRPLEVDLTGPFDAAAAVAKAPSSLLSTSPAAVPEGHYNDETMRQTVVPGRNLIFASVLAAVAESVGADWVALGVHQGDHQIYPDCRPGFVSALGRTVAASTDGRVRVFTPLLHWDKAGVVREGIRLGVPFRLTRTCYTFWEAACGKCGACRERLEAFEKNGVPDPIEYQK
jgi:7-cyano-7-deazaguanine synthase